jgi:hypothetical protein
MQPEDLLPVIVTTLSDKTDTLHYAMRQVERRQRQYNEVLYWGRDMLALPEGVAMTNFVARRIMEKSVELHSAQVDAETAHREYLAASAALGFKGD